MIPGAPDTPLQPGKTGWRDVLKRSVKEFKNDRCTMTAGSLAEPRIVRAAHRAGEDLLGRDMLLEGRFFCCGSVSACGALA